MKKMTIGVGALYIAGKGFRTKLRGLLSRRNIIIFVVLVMIALAAFTLSNIKRFSLYEMKRTLENLGGYSYIVFFLLCCIRSLLFLPCGLFSTLGGLLFGFTKGTLITLIGLTIGSLINFYLARLLGKEWTDRFTKGKIRNIDNLISKNGFFSILVLRMIPLFPFDAVSCVGGLSRVSTRDFFLGTLLGSIPGVLIHAFLGYSVKSLSVKKIAFALAVLFLTTSIPLLYKFVFKKKFYGRV